MIALKHILVATDFSEPSAAAVDYGRDLATLYDATLHVLHVIEDMAALYAPELGFALAEVERNIEAAVQSDLDATIGTFEGDTKVRAIVTRGSNVAHAITEYANTNAIDLIIVGTRGRGAVSRFLIGSVAKRVVRTASCPVLTVHADERDVIERRHHTASLLQSTTNHH